MRSIEHWIAGKATSGRSDRSAPVYNPATGQQQAEVVLATTDDVAEAVLALLRNTFVTGEIMLLDGGYTQVV